MSFTLVPSMGEKYEIFAQSAHELHQWIEALGSSKRKIMEVKSVVIYHSSKL